MGVQSRYGILTAADVWTYGVRVPTAQATVTDELANIPSGGGTYDITTRGVVLIYTDGGAGVQLQELISGAWVTIYDFTAVPIVVTGVSTGANLRVVNGTIINPIHLRVSGVPSA